MDSPFFFPTHIVKQVSASHAHCLTVSRYIPQSYFDGVFSCVFSGFIQICQTLQ